MLDSSSEDFIRLPRERVLIRSPARTALQLQSPNSYPGKEPVNIKCTDGRATITNQRVEKCREPYPQSSLLTTSQLIYLPSSPTPQFQSLSVPLLSLQDTHITAPFFGANSWEGVLIPTAGGGFAQQHHVVQIKLTFKEGGAFDFHTTYEQIKEQVAHAAEIARDNGRTNGHTNAPIDVDLEQLPAYEEQAPPQPPAPSSNGDISQVQRPVPIAPNGTARPAPAQILDDPVEPPQQPSAEPFNPPNEPPPGYEETQSTSVANDLEQRLRTQ